MANLNSKEKFRSKFKITTKLGTIEPDFILKDITEDDVKNMPSDFRIFWFLVQKNQAIPQWMLNDMKDKHPERFEKNTVIYGIN